MESADPKVTAGPQASSSSWPSRTDNSMKSNCMKPSEVLQL